MREVGEALGCGKTYVYVLIARGELRTVKLGRLRRILASTLSDFVRKLVSNTLDIANTGLGTVRTSGRGTSGEANA